MTSRCNAIHGRALCLLPPDHDGFHKSNYEAWPNAADRFDWAGAGRRLLRGELVDEPFSKVEMEYAVDAARRTPPTSMPKFANPRLSERSVAWAESPGTGCRECRARGDWVPRVDQSGCPECAGSDAYGQPSFCAECEFCCGC